MADFLKESIKPIVHRLLEDAWKVKQEEKILIISDYPAPEDFVNKPTSILESIVERNLLAKRIFDIIKEHKPKTTYLHFIKPTYEHYVDPNDSEMNKKISESDIKLPDWE